MIAKLYEKEEHRNDVWAKQISDDIIALAISEHNESKEIDSQSWDMFNGKRDSTKFKYLTNVENLTYPAKLRNIGNTIVRSKVNLLESKQSRREFRFKVVTIDERSLKEKILSRVTSYMKAVKEVYDEREDMFAMQMQEIVEKQQEMQEMMQAEPQNEEHAQQLEQLKANMPMIQVQLKKMIRILQNAQIENTELRKKIDYHLLHSEQELIQEIANASLKSALITEDLYEHWHKGFREKIVTDKPRFLVYYDKNVDDIRFRQVNSLSCYYSMGGNNKWIHNGEWCAVKEFMTQSQILSEYELTKEQIELVQSHNTSSYTTLRNYEGNTAVFDENSSGNSTYEGIEVWRIWFLAPRDIFYKESPNKHRTNESFWNLTTKEAKLKDNEKRYKATIYDMYHTVVIGNTICVNMGKQDKVFRSIDIPGLPILPMIGRAFSNVGDQPHSIIHSVKDLRELYDIINYKKELAICLAGIKGMIMDKSQKPDDMSIKAWTYYRKMGTMWIETVKKGRNVNASFNQFQNYDDSLSESIMLHDSMLANIEFIMGKVMGITDAALGQFVKDDPVSNVRMSNEQSSLISEILFYDNDKVFTEALNLYLNLKLRFVWSKGKVLNYLNKDLEEVIVQIPKGMLKMADFRIYTNNSIKLDERLEDLRQIGIQSWAKGEITLPSITKVIAIEDIQEMEKTLVQMHKESMDISQQQQLNIEEQKGQIEERKMQLQMQIDQNLEAVRMQAKDMETQIELRKLEFENFKFQWEAQFKERELQAKQQIEGFKVASENEIESAYLQEEGRNNITNQKLKEFEIKINALLSQSDNDSKRMDKGTYSVPLNNMRNKENVKD